MHRTRPSGNLVELIGALAVAKDPADTLKIQLITSESTESPEKTRKQLEFLLHVKNAAQVAGIAFDVRLDSKTHDRSIVADTGWRINLGRGLDIFQYVSSDAFDLAARVQEYRQVRAFGVTYIRDNGVE